MRVLLTISILVLLVSCKKDKLKDEYSILQGKWKWVYAREFKTVLNNGNTSSSIIYASDFPDSYYTEFKRKGKVDFLRNDVIEETYRVVIFSFNDDCNIFNNCRRYTINLNNNEEMSTSGRVSEDSLAFVGANYHFPLNDRVEDVYSYNYEYYFAKVN